MKKYRMVTNLRGLGLPDDDIIKRAIYENNTAFEVWQDTLTMETIIKCENQPRDMPFFGIKFVEVLEA